jgi:hypothetical protein
MKTVLPHFFFDTEAKHMGTRKWIAGTTLVKFVIPAEIDKSRSFGQTEQQSTLDPSGSDQPQQREPFEATARQWQLSSMVSPLPMLVMARRRSAAIL